MLNNQLDLIDPSRLMPGKLRASPRSSLFVSVGSDPDDNGIPYLAGSINDRPVLVALRGGEAAFAVRETERWPERHGYSIVGIGIEVDRDRIARRFDERDCRPGEIIRHEGGIGIVANDGHSNHIIDLLGQPVPDSSALVLLAFSRWEIILGTGTERHVLYHYTGRELLFGPFDPEVDEEV